MGIPFGKTERTILFGGDLAFDGTHEVERCMPRFSHLVKPLKIN